MNHPIFHYRGTDNPVHIGDRILIRGWLGRARLATIVYIPGQSAPDNGLGNDQWAYKTDNGWIYAIGYDPTRLPNAGKSIQFVSRAGAEAQEVIHSYRMPPEQPDGTSGRDLLAFIGCGTLIAIAIVVCIVTCRALFPAG